MAKSAKSWQGKQAAVKPQAQVQVQAGKKGGYVSDKNIDFNKNQSIEELTGGRIKKQNL